MGLIVAERQPVAQTPIIVISKGRLVRQTLRVRGACALMKRIKDGREVSVLRIAAARERVAQDLSASKQEMTLSVSLCVMGRAPIAEKVMYAQILGTLFWHVSQIVPITPIVLTRENVTWSQVFASPIRVWPPLVPSVQDILTVRVGLVLQRRISACPVGIVRVSAASPVLCVPMEGSV